MICFPQAKINIGLSITGKRKDGYHKLESLLYPIPLYDCLECLPGQKHSLTIYGQEKLPDDKSNLVWQAYELLKEIFDLPPLSFHLLKNIPVGAGLGGGSSNAASALKLMNNYFDLGLSIDELQKLAARLGSDCPFFIRQKPSWISGRGDHPEEVGFSLKGYFLALVCPQVRIPTKLAFGKITPRQKETNLRKYLLNNPPEKWDPEIVKNDFESLLSEYPQSEQVKNQLQNLGFDYVSLTGSGSAIYALSRSPIDFKSNFPGHFCWSCFL